MIVEMVSQHLLGPAILGLGSRQILSWWICCICFFAIWWFSFFWASALVIGVKVVSTLRWLLTLGIISLIFLSSLLSSLGWLWRGGPLRNHGLQPDACSVTLALLHPCCQHPPSLPLHRGVGILCLVPIGSLRTMRWELCLQ